MQAENLCREHGSRMARHRLPAKLRALGDSAANGALRLLKPQFSPTRNAPLDGRFGASAARPADPPRARFHGIFSDGSRHIAAFLTRLKQHVRRLTQDTAGERRFGSRTPLRLWRWPALKELGNTMGAMIWAHLPRIAACAFAALAACSLIATPALAQGTVKSVHADWQIRCDTPPGAQGEQCALIQSVTAEDRPNVGLTVIVLKTADQKSRLMRVLAPLGVLLPSGLGLKIDKTDVGRAGFVRCLPNGCVAEVVMDDNLVKQLRTGTSATFIIFQTPEEGIGIPMGLKGFGEGYDKLP